jgi:phosphoglycerate kinase
MAKTLDGIKSIDQFDLDDKRLFLRLDLNVPFDDKGKISDDTRIRAAIPTIQCAIDKGAKIVLASHLGRPKKMPEDRAKFSLEPVADYLNTALKKEIILVEEPRSDAPKALLAGLKPSQIILLENLRFDPGEEKNDRDFAQVLASFTDVYINDAFGASHRAHASIVALPELVDKKGIGFLMKKEIEMLDKIKIDPTPPFLAILGGAKVSDKIVVLEKLLETSQGVLIGGAMAFTFLSAQGISVGSSLVEKEKLKFAKDLLDRIKLREKKFLLPVDHVIVQSLKDPSTAKVTEGVNIPEGWMGVDIGPKTRALYAAEIGKAKTIFWNGPMGVFEIEQLSAGTFAVAKAIAGSSSFNVVGGGDSAAAAEASGVADKFSHISTGGGASLEYLEGAKLPGLEAVRFVKRESSPLNVEA